MNAAPTPLPPDARLRRDPSAAIAVPLAPIVLEGRYRLLVGALWRLGRSRRGQWVLAAGSEALVVALPLLAARHPESRPPLWSSLSPRLATSKRALRFRLGRSGSASRSRWRSSFSAPARRRRRCRSAPRARPRGSAPAAQPSSARVSGTLRHSVSPSPSGPSGSSPGGAIFAFAVAWRTGLSLVPARA
jgi:hypothetical protein